MQQALTDSVSTSVLLSTADNKKVPQFMGALNDYAEKSHDVLSQVNYFFL